MRPLQDISYKCKSNEERLMIINELRFGCPEIIFLDQVLEDVEDEVDFMSYPTIFISSTSDEFVLTGTDPTFYSGINPNTAVEFLSYFNIKLKPQPVRWENNKIIMNFI